MPTNFTSFPIVGVVPNETILSNTFDKVVSIKNGRLVQVPGDTFPVWGAAEAAESAAAAAVSADAAADSADLAEAYATAPLYLLEETATTVVLHLHPDRATVISETATPYPSLTLEFES